MVIGEVIGPYRVVAPIGAGGMGSVWLAKHGLLDTSVAIKILLPEVSQRSDIVQRFFDEARAAGRIAHPGIVKIIDFGWHGSTAYLVMEHLEGESLSARLRQRGTLPIARAARLVRECAITMAAAHARGIIHRDLKPDNVFLTPDPVAPDGERAKILDFGIAKLTGEDDRNHPRTRSDMIMGTPAYMSPEQCRGAGEVDLRTDIYALGCVLFHLVCGRPPFVSGASGDLIASHLLEAPPIPSTLVPDAAGWIDEVIARCLMKDPAARLASMEALAAALVPRDVEATSPARTEPHPRTDMATQPTAASASTSAAPSTTLGASAAELRASRSRWRGGVLVASVAVAMLAGVATIVSIGDDRRTTTHVPMDGSATSIEPDRGTGLSAAVAPDAATRTETEPDATRPDARPRTNVRDGGPLVPRDARVPPRDARVTAPRDVLPAPRDALPVLRDATSRLPAPPDASAYDHR